MKSTLLIALFLAFISTSYQSSHFKLPFSFDNLGPFKHALNSVGFQGGHWNCFLCTWIVSQSITYSYTNQIDIDDFLKNQLCTFFKAPLNSLCTQFINNFGDALIDALDKDASPDYACNQIKWCITPQCYLYPNKTKDDFKVTFSKKYTPNTFEAYPSVTDFDPWKELEQWFAQFGQYQRPDIDFDNDTFSYYEAYARGYNWKGRDCNDYDAQVYPGRAVNPHKNNDDYNCNGIFGFNQTLNMNWKDILCGNSTPMGTIVLGDSGGAHFEFPPNWFNGSLWNKTTFDNFVPRAMDEFDLPQYSGYTSFYPEAPDGPAHSIYQYMYQRNKCNFRDYQNGAVNGRTAVDELGYAQRSIHRNQKTDHPALLFLELIGNDVCASDPSGYTTPSQFQTGILNVLNYLDTILPNGSKVISVGLADGLYLYSIMYNRTHPLNVTYEHFYDWMSCIDINPCPGWLNSNATLRNYTQTWANNLNTVYQQIIDSGVTFNNFEYTYFPFPTTQIFNNWTSTGGSPADLIEPVDGFHPSQLFHSMLADYFWNELLSEYSDWLPPVNPNNDLISQIFGDQGGY